MPVAVVIHGANGSSVEIEPLSEALRPYAQVHAPDLLGHGGREVPEVFTLPELAADVIAWLDRQGLARVFWVGYSVGGLLALYLARHYPERVIGVAAVAAKAVIDENTVKHWTYLASVERLSRPGNPRAAQLEKVHAPRDWRDVARANQRFFAELGKAVPLPAPDLAQIDAPVILVNSNRDPLVPWGETVALAKLLPRAKLVMFYGLAHPIGIVPVHRVAQVLGEWMAGVERQAA